jgi:hypothetical protein
MGGPRIEKGIFFCVFSVLGNFVPHKTLRLSIFHRFDLTRKNRAEKPMVGFWVFADSDNIAA